MLSRGRGADGAVGVRARSRRVKVLTSVVLALALGTSGASGAGPRAAPIARLTDSVVPVSYDLTVAPNVETLRTDGSESLVVDVRDPVDAIVLNARAIEVRHATIDGRPARAELTAAVEQLALRSEGRIARGRHRVDLTFSSAVQDGFPKGLFRGRGEARLMTIFEPSTARTMFPCFDEPQFRARFTLHVRAPSAWTVVSNMPLHARRELGGGVAQNDFGTTPPMPTYLLTLDAAPFVHVDGAAAGVPIRVFVRHGQEAHARTMLADAQRLLPFYERFFGVRFPLPKLDLVVADGFVQSALEGWGAISFYSEAAPFGQQFHGGARGRRLAVEMLAHEMAHQWAGDLVTMRWWRDTFVAEGLAQFSQREASRIVFPQLQAWRDDDRSVADVMRNGVTARARPVLSPIATDLDAEDYTVFASATYDKGASVIGGWRDVAGERAFGDALARYIRRFAYSSATFEDFWSTIGGAAGMAYGHSWLAQRGFPVVDVRRTCAKGRTRVVITQSPFVSDPQIDAAYRAQTWIVPLVVRNGTVERHLLQRARTLTESLPSCARVDVEPEGRYYLVRYDDASYAEQARSDSTNDERRRARSYRDAAILHANGALRDAPYLTLVATAREPLEPDVWIELANEYDRMDELVRGTPEARTLAAIQREALLPIARRYGTIDSSDTAMAQLGDAAADALASAGDPADGAPFRAEFDKVAAGARARNYGAVYATATLAAASATAQDVARSETRMLAKTELERHNGTLEVVYLQNIGDEALARRVFDDAMRDRRLAEGRPMQFLLAFGARHPEIAFGYLREHMEELKPTVAVNDRAQAIVMGVAKSLWRAAPPSELERFLQTWFPDDAATVRAAVALIERKNRERRALLLALRSLAAHPK
jgi:aminopeptidase N